jgi:hypothetical protein
MIKVTVDAAMLAQLGQVETVSEICDADGRTVGYFHPTEKRLAREENVARSPFSDEELQRRRQQRRGRSLAEILE